MKAACLLIFPDTSNEEYHHILLNFPGIDEFEGGFRSQSDISLQDCFDRFSLDRSVFAAV
jgi:hypothetical protein